MSETLAYGNDYQMILFEVKITDFVVEGLINLGFLEEDEFDKEAYDEEFDAYDSRELAKPVFDAIIDYYEFQVDEEEDNLAEKEVKDEWNCLWEDSSDLEKILLINEFDNFCECVTIKEVDPLDPYGLNKRNNLFHFK